MLRDRYSFEHSSSCQPAIDAFEDVVTAVASHRPAGPALTTALGHDPHLVGALALKGLAAVIMASEGAMRIARDGCPTMRAALLAARGGGTGSERALVEACELAAQGRLNAAAIRLEQHLVVAPRDFLAAKIAHALRFMSGEPAAMLATTSTVLPHWRDDAPGFGFLLGCHAFSLEETANFSAAEIAGRRAVEHERSDVWALHAVAHVMEMRSRVREGIVWLQPTTELWRECGNFGGHLAWHFALFQLSSGEHATALEVFDTHLHTAPTCDFRDVANATSLLWRLEQEGIDVGRRWDQVGEIALQRRRDTAYVFGALHGLLALIGSRQFAAAADLVAALREAAASGNGDQATVADVVGVELAETILAMAERRMTASPLAARPLAGMAERLQRLGGSIAQRDVFLRTLMLIAAETGDDLGLVKLTALRLRQRKEDHFFGLVDRRRGIAPGRAGDRQLATA